MLKKSKFLLAIMLIMTLTLTACGNGSEDNGGSDDGTPTAALLISHRGDLSFNDSAIRGVEKAGEELEIDTTVLEYGNEPDNFEASVVDAAEAGYDVIIVSSTLRDYVEEYAEEYSDTVWVLFDSGFDFESGDYGNVYTIQYSANEGSYLGGYLSAKLSESDVLGFLGGVEAPIINDFLMGYVQGAQKANPDIKVAVNYTGSWTDSAKGKELSLAMNNQGADIVFGVAGGAGVGAFEAAVERDFSVLGVDSDQAMIYEDSGRTEFSELIFTSVLKNVDNSLYRALDLYLKDELTVGETEVLGLKEGGVGIAENKYYDEQVSEELQAEVEALEEEIANGEIEVESAYDKTTEEIQSTIDSVRP